jgi:hypothetical protein
LARNDSVRAVLKLEFGRDPGMRLAAEASAANYVIAWLLMGRGERAPADCTDREDRGRWLLGRVLEYCQDRLDCAEQARRN